MSGVTCQDVRNLFDAHLNGELPPPLETELNAHRLKCPACRHELALLEVAGEVIAADDGAPALDDAFGTRLMACLAERNTSRQVRRRRLVRIGARALATAACLALAVIYFTRPVPRVAGERHEAARTNASRMQTDAVEQDTAMSQAAFRAQLEQALTDWREDASSLKKVYDFITPQTEEMRLEHSENVHDQPGPFELGRPGAPPESDVVSTPTIEDI